MTAAVRILVVDDEEAFRYTLSTILTSEGYGVETAADGAQAINLLQSKPFDVALLDMKMPKIDGIEVLRFLKDNTPETEAIMQTAVADIKTAVECMKIGAYDYLTKPCTSEDLTATIERALERRRLIRQARVLKSEITRLAGTTEIVGQSEALKAVLNLAARVAASDSTVLVRGASGTGKELIANFIYSNSARKDAPFVAVNCSSIPDTLIESELFGYEKGAFTDARSMKQGLVEITDGGTLFLDEVGDVSPALQPKLLRFVQSGEFRRVGGTAVLTSNVRIISATNKDLAAEVRAGRFREDLLYRLNVITIEIPPLRDRKDDIPILVDWFLSRKVKGAKKIGARALEMLRGYDWPGNVRELENVIERAAILSDEDTIQPQDLSLPLRAVQGAGAGATEGGLGSLVSLKEIERQHIGGVLASLQGNKPKAAEILGISLKTLYTKLSQYRIKSS